MNLFWLQYYFTRMFIGTDTYVPFNGFRKINNNPASTKTDITVNLHENPDTYTLRDTTPFNVTSISTDLTNISCQNSGTDYLLLVLIDKDIYDNAPELDYTSDLGIGVGATHLHGTQRSQDDPNRGREISSNGLYIVGNTIKKMTGRNPSGVHFFSDIVDPIPVSDDPCNTYTDTTDATYSTIDDCIALSGESTGVGIDGRDCKIDNGKCVTDMNALTSQEKAWFDNNPRRDQITDITLNEAGQQGDYLRYGINFGGTHTACSPDQPAPYTLIGTGPVTTDQCKSDFCLGGYCIQHSSDIPEIERRLTRNAH